MPADGHLLAHRLEAAAAATHRHNTPDRAWEGDAASRVILVSNRGPIEYQATDDGGLRAGRGAGGVVSGLLCAVQERPATWIALAMSDADRQVARGELGAAVPTPDGLEHLALRLVDVPEAVYHRHYESISNRLLWFAQHYLLQPTDSRLFSRRTRSDWEQGYRTANEAVADAVIAELEVRGSETPVVFQDYHLYLAPARVRERFPQARLSHFVHIPWPDARYWEMLPEYIVRAIYAGLAANDLVGFQTLRDARNFLAGAERFLDDAEVRWATDGDAPGELRWQGRRITPRVYPIAVTPSEVQASADSREAVAEAVALSEELGLDDTHQLIVRVDRVEPTKNIVRGFQAYERLLQRHPELHGRVTFLALLVPSRQSMQEYRACERQVRQRIERVNARFGRPDWQPIVAVFDNHRPRALACMRRYDVLLVNPLIDGMNLVVKEGGLVNRRAGSIVLSRTAGAYEQLHDYVLGIAPTDVDATAEALYQSLTMTRRERSVRARGVRQILHEEDATLWLDAQLRDLLLLTVPIAPARRRGTRRMTPIPAASMGAEGWGTPLRIAAARSDMRDTISAAADPGSRRAW